MKKFKATHNLTNIVHLNDLQLSGLPKTYNVSGSQLSAYKEALLLKNKKISTIQMKIYKKLKVAKEELSNKILLAGALSGCCSDNNCKANVFDKARVNIVPMKSDTIK